MVGGWRLFGLRGREGSASIVKSNAWIDFISCNFGILPIFHILSTRLREEESLKRNFISSLEVRNFYLDLALYFVSL